jgi:hypothetical protein
VSIINEARASARLDSETRVIEPLPKMRAVCLREPWLYLMLDITDPDLVKNVENRARCLTRALGPILVKSSARKAKLGGVDPDLGYYTEVRKRVLGWGWFPEKQFPRFDDLQFGGIRGALNFASIIEPWATKGEAYRWKFPECFGYVVDKRTRLPFRKVKGGGQGIFYTEPTEDEAAALRAGGLLVGST